MQGRENDIENECRTTSDCLDDLRGRWRRQLGAKYCVPEAASHPETVFVVHEVMLHVILLELFVVEGQAARLLMMCCRH
jgi:hypothetical protein